MAQIINKDDLVAKLQLMDAFSGATKKATKEFIEDFFNLIGTEIIAGNKISITKFGKFEALTRQDGTKYPKFSAFSEFKEAVKASK